MLASPAGVTERYLILEGQGHVEVGDLPPEDVGRARWFSSPPARASTFTNAGGADLIFLAIDARFTRAVMKTWNGLRRTRKLPRNVAAPGSPSAGAMRQLQRRSRR